MRLTLLALFGAMLLLASSGDVFAQQTPMFGPSQQGDEELHQPTPPPPPPPVPINGALALLALAGGAFAVRRIRQSED